MNKTLQFYFFSSSYIWLLKLSYLWYCVIGFCTVFFGGWLLSFLFDLIHCGGEKKIFIDSKEMYYDTDLFVPPVAKYLLKQNAKRLKTDYNVSIIGHTYDLDRLGVGT